MKKNNKNLKNTSPLIFINKINNKHHIIPINLTVNTGGPIKHFPPATKEWFNSIYAYNDNTIKNLSVANKNLSKLLKSYFNFYFSNEVIKSKGVGMRFRRLKIKKIFVSKAEVKHINSKVIITLYVYNEEKRDLSRKIKKLTSVIFPSNNIIYYKNFWRKKRSLHYVEKINTWLYEYNRTPLLTWISNNISHYLKELISERNKFSYIKKNKTSLKDTNLLNRKNLLNGLEQWIDINSISIEKHHNLLCLDALYFDFLYWIHIGKEYKVIKYYKTLLKLNKAKFNGVFIDKLKPLISQIYNKEVEFNIVNLKSLYFNSDIFTQAITLKLKQRKNRLIRVLKSALYLVKLPKENLIKDRYYKTVIKNLWTNKVKNLKVNLLLNNMNSSKFTNNKKDILNNTLLEVFHSFSFIKNYNRKINTNYKEYIKKTTLLDFILKDLKHKDIAGVRLEAKGRLTRRLTASRSVFKIKWKGGLRNIDSSYRGLSAVMLRGHVKSNVQYSIMSSKTRNGAFGLKGWISSK